MFSINPSSGTPIYRQIIEQVRHKMASGQLKPGDELPSVRDLAQEHALNPMTISKAYTLLEAEGLLVRQRGKPMQIAALKQPEMDEAQRLAYLLPALKNLVQSAQQLNISPERLTQALDAAWAQESE